MYPTVVILLVETQRSMADICEISSSSAGRLAGPVVSEAHPATLGHLSFAVMNSTTDNDTKSLSSRASHSGDVQERDLEKVILEVNLKENRASTSS